MTIEKIDIQNHLSPLAKSIVASERKALTPTNYSTMTLSPISPNEIIHVVTPTKSHHYYIT